jgi:hypothetical protein
MNYYSEKYFPCIQRQRAFCFVFFFLTTFIFGQSVPQQYVNIVKQADSLYNAKDYLKAAQAYSEAFKTNGWKGLATDRYNAACSWALARIPDSAFFQLTRIAIKSNYSDYKHITTDGNLNSLHRDKRWNLLLDLIKQNKDKAEANYNQPWVALLDSIYEEDQQCRVQSIELEKKYGWDSKEVKNLWKIISKKDSSNLVVVKSILDKYGWLGTDVVGGKGNQALFLVIQHSNRATQERYLPMMREAVKNGKAQGTSLALLEDRVALAQGKRQIYGSQVAQDPVTHTYYVRPLEDPDHVDKRRAEVGLGPIAEYVSNWKIKWDVEQYKKDLLMLEKK